MDQARILSRCPILGCRGAEGTFFGTWEALLYCSASQCIFYTLTLLNSFNIQFTSLPGTPSQGLPSRLILHRPSSAQGRDHLPCVDGGHGGHCYTGEEL